MASFYQDMNEEDVRSHNKRFIENFRKEFGHLPNMTDISHRLDAILEEKVKAFVEQNYSDFPPIVITKMLNALPVQVTEEQYPIQDPDAQAMPDYDQPEPEIQEVAPKEKKQKIKAKK